MIVNSMVQVLKELIVTQLVKQFFTLYGTWRFIIMLARHCHWTLSDAS